MLCSTCATAETVEDEQADLTEWDPRQKHNSSTVRAVRDLGHAALVLDSLRLLRRDRALCDVTVVVGDSHWPAHRTVLAAVSPFFRDMFTSTYGANLGDQVELQTFDPDTFDCVLRFIYTGVAVLSLDSVSSMLDAAEILQISSLREHCIVFLVRNCTLENALSVWTLARLHDAPELASVACRCFLEAFPLLAKKAEFLILPERDLETILTAPFISAKEDVILYMLCRWVERDVDNRMGAFKRLMRHVFPNLLDEHKLRTSTELHPCLQDPEVLEFLSQRREEHLSMRADPDDEDGSSSETVLRGVGQWPVHTRRCSTTQQVIMVISGATCSGFSSGIECLTDGMDSWRYSVPRMISSVNMNVTCTEPMARLLQMRSYHAAAADDRWIYVIGGILEGTPLCTAERYDVTAHRVTSMPDLPGTLHGATACVAGGRLYVLGGSFNGSITNRVWMWSEEGGVWEERARMIEPRAHHCSAVVRGHIYVVGGIRSAYNYMSSVCRYDALQDRWTVAPPCGPPRAYAGCASVGDQLYLMGGHNGLQWLRTVRRLNPVENQWYSMGAMPQPLGLFACTVMGDLIYCMGGFTGADYMRACYKYNPRTDRWHTSRSMHLTRWAMCAVTMWMPLMVESDP